MAEIANSNVDKKSYEDGHPVRLCNYTDVYYNDFITDDMELMAATATGQEIRRFALRPGDVIITKDSESWDDIAVPACVAEELTNVVCGYHLSLFRPLAGRLDGRFLLRALQAQGVREQFWTAANGVTRFGLGQQGMKDALLPVPPLPTQKAIAAFLDRKTAAIDALIEKKQKLLDLLAEKRAALINQAVTKGLDPNVPMKDSGIPWIGEIPAHWEVKKLSWLLHDGPRNGVSPSVSHDGSGVPSFSLSVVRDGMVEVRGDDVKYVMASDADAHRFNVMAGDLLMVRGNGNINLVGATGLVRDDKLSPYVYPDLLMRMRCGDGVCPGYVQYCINSDVVRPQLTASARTTVGTYKVNNQQVRELRLLAPPQSEAVAISKHLDVALERHRGLVGAVQAHIKRLQEYRQALITAAVTGQLDIPEEDA
ncbi:hypothetical protein KKB55_09680 [Myxococcota bacterium]|nr:hypothetical protein [Myxococcota bacterium]